MRNLLTRTPPGDQRPGSSLGLRRLGVRDSVPHDLSSSGLRHFGLRDFEILSFVGGKTPEENLQSDVTLHTSPVDLARAEWFPRVTR
jgi:hypothetical protein